MIIKEKYQLEKTLSFVEAHKTISKAALQGKIGFIFEGSSAMAHNSYVILLETGAAIRIKQSRNEIEIYRKDKKDRGEVSILEKLLKRKLKDYEEPQKLQGGPFFL